MQAPMNGPFVLTSQSLTSFIAQQQRWSSGYRHCATGCFVLGAALVFVQVHPQCWLGIETVELTSVSYAL